MEKPAEIEEEEDVVPEKLQEEPEKKAEPPSPQKVVIEKKPIVPFMMGGRSYLGPCGFDGGRDFISKPPTR